MLYISIILILLGIIILIYSISVEVRKHDVSPSMHAPRGAVDAYEKDVLHEEDRDLPAAREKSTGIYTEEPVREIEEVTEEVTEEWDGAYEQVSTDPMPVAPDEKDADEVAAVIYEERAQAVLYDDSSNIIDYSLGNGRIDPTLEEYSKIIRVGKGDLCIEKNGINFHMLNKYYRYDFHRFEDFKAGDNYIAVTLKGTQATKLFILENKLDLIGIIADQYRNYSGS